MKRLSSQNVLKKKFFSVIIQKNDDGLICVCAIKLKKSRFFAEFEKKKNNQIVSGIKEKDVFQKFPQQTVAKILHQFLKSDNSLYTCCEQLFSEVLIKSPRVSFLSSICVPPP